MKDTRLYLIHVAECIEKINRYAEGGREKFLESELVQDAVLRNLQTLAESVKYIPDDDKAQFPDIDWRAIVAFRNLLVHDYLGVNVERVWKVVQRDLPPLYDAIKEMFEESEG